MTTRWRASTISLVCLMTHVVSASVGLAQSSTPPLPDSGAVAVLRVFLTDGTALLSYGEPSRVGDRVVFALPTSADEADPRLHLVNLPADRIDWARTNRYTEAVRAARYVANHGDEQYAMLTAEIAQALNDIGLAPDAAGRVAIAERARRTLAEWPATHYDYKASDIRQMLGVLDEAIADLRVAAGLDRFDLNFVATIEPPAREPMLPPPTPREAIEQTIAAARLSPSSVDRVSLMAVALATIDKDADRLPSDWRTSARAELNAAIAAELRTDRAYQTIASRAAGQSLTRARAADVRGLERLLNELDTEDASLGRQRPEVMVGLVALVRADLDAARQLRLDRDRWALRLPDLKKYQDAVAAPLARLRETRDLLEDIRSLAGSLPDALASVERAASQALQVLTLLPPPDELRSVHALFVSAAQLADNAARVRREAALTGDMTRAWDASSAAAGSLMLAERAEAEMQSVLSLPQLPQ